MLTTLMQPDGGRGHASPGPICSRIRKASASASATSRRSAAAIRRSPGDGADPPGPAVRAVARPSEAPREAALARSISRRGRPQDRHLFRRAAPAARHRARHHPPAAAAVPRRADHRSRSAEPHPLVGRGAAAPRASDTTVFLTTHYLDEADALCRSAADHRPRAHRRRGHARRAEATHLRRRRHAGNPRRRRAGAAGDRPSPGRPRRHRQRRHAAPHRRPG